MTATARCAWRPSLTRGACWHRRCARRQVRHLDRPRYSSRCTATPPRTCCRTGASGRAPSYPRVCCAAPLCCLRCLSPPECAGHCFPKMACRQGELLRSSSAAHDHDVLAHAVKLRVLVVPACGCAADLLGDALPGLLQVLEALQKLDMHRSPYARRLVQSAAPATAPRSDALCTA